MNSWTRRLFLACILALCLAALQVEPSLAQCGKDANGGPIPCPEVEKEKRRRPTEIPPTATFTPTLEPTATSTSIPTATDTALPTPTFTPTSALMPPAAPNAPANSANYAGWLPMTGLALLLLLGLGYVLPRLRPIADGGSDTDAFAGTAKGDKVKDTPRNAGPQWEPPAGSDVDTSGPLDLDGDLGGGTYHPGSGISLTAELQLEPSFQYDKRPVTANLHAGGPPVETTPDPLDGVIDPFSGADAIPDPADSLELSGDPKGREDPRSEGFDADGELQLRDDFDHRRDDVEPTLDSGEAHDESKDGGGESSEKDSS